MNDPTKAISAVSEIVWACWDGIGEAAEMTGAIREMMDEHAPRIGMDDEQLIEILRGVQEEKKEEARIDTLRTAHDPWEGFSDGL